MSSEDAPTAETSTPAADDDADDNGTSADGESVRIDGDGTVRTQRDGTAAADERVATPTATENPEPEADGFGRAGWLLVGVVVVCFVLIPGVIYLYPYVLGSFGLTFMGTYLMLPLVPAVLLGLVAVWSMSAAA